eukprot:14612574-Alexandrium_andersonii.AAC.1
MQCDGACSSVLLCAAMRCTVPCCGVLPCNAKYSSDAIFCGMLQCSAAQRSAAQCMDASPTAYAHARTRARAHAHKHACMH